MYEYNSSKNQITRNAYLGSIAQSIRPSPSMLAKNVGVSVRW